MLLDFDMSHLALSHILSCRGIELPFKPLKRDTAFTLVETLVSAVLLALLVASTASLFTVATQSVRRTGEFAAANSSIETDISRMRELTERYTYCTGSWTSSPASCTHQFGNSFYYFPQSPADIPSFFAACEAAGPSDHLTSQLISDMNGLLPKPTDGVTRAVSRVNSSDSTNHLIRVYYSSPRLSRAVIMRPVVSSWCR